MERNFLKGLGIADEAIEKIMAENGKDIEGLKATQTTAQTTIADLQKQIKDRDTQLDTLKKSSGDNEALKQQISTLQEQNKTKQTEFDTKLKQVKLDALLETRLMKEGAVNTKAVRALLDPSKISLDGDNLIGIDDQLKSLKETEKWAFGAPTKVQTALETGSPVKTDMDDVSKAFYAKNPDLKPTE